MPWLKRSVHAAFPVFAGLAFAFVGVEATGSGEPERPAQAEAPPSLAEARARARLLHGTIHDALQLVHAVYFREDDGLPIPAATFKRMFRTVADREGVELHWLAVETPAMNLDHKARTPFEKNAVKVLVSGEEEYESVEGGVYRRVGAVTLGADCLKCHAPARSSNNSRKAGLLIAIPIGKG